MERHGYLRCRQIADYDPAADSKEGRDGVGAAAWQAVEVIAVEGFCTFRYMEVVPHDAAGRGSAVAKVRDAFRRGNGRRRP